MLVHQKGNVKVSKSRTLRGAASCVSVVDRKQQESTSERYVQRWRLSYMTSTKEEGTPNLLFYFYMTLYLCIFISFHFPLFSLLTVLNRWKWH